MHRMVRWQPAASRASMLPDVRAGNCMLLSISHAPRCTNYVIFAPGASHDSCSATWSELTAAVQELDQHASAARCRPTLRFRTRCCSIRGRS